MRRSLLVSLVLGLLAATAAYAQAANRWIEPKTPLNIAHQGGEDEFPSNTMYAFRKALKVGADMLELDIGVTKDGKVIVMHDTTVDGKTNGHGTVASKTLRQIKQLDAAFWFAPGASDHYSHALPPRSYKFPRHRHRQAQAAEGLQGRGLPCADACGGPQGVPEDARSTSRSRGARPTRRPRSTSRTQRCSRGC